MISFFFYRALKIKTKTHTPRTAELCVHRSTDWEYFIPAGKELTAFF